MHGIRCAFAFGEGNLRRGMTATMGPMPNSSRSERVSSEPTALRLGMAAALATAMWALIAAPGAGATTVTVGSPLTAAFGSANSWGVSGSTVTNDMLPEAGAHVTSPISGTIVRWRILNASGGPFKLRVLTPDGGNTYTGAGTSAGQTPASTALQTFPANLPIQAGQTIGIDIANKLDSVGAAHPVSGAHYFFWSGPLADGSMSPGTNGGLNPGELAFNADVQSPDVQPRPTGQRAAALKKCKKKHSHRARKKCKKKAKLLPV
jgi:hypothetical protein